MNNNYFQFQELIKSLEKYPNLADLRYIHNYNQEAIENVLKGKYDDERFCKLSLFNEAEEPLLYLLSKNIIDKFEGSADLISNSNIDELNDVSDKELIYGFIFSEIESSLSIEGVRSTRQKIEKISKLTYKELTSNNEIVVKNMINAYEYIVGKEITEENLFELYNIISKDCLKESNKLLKGNYYRHDGVDIVGNNEVIIDHGVNHDNLIEMMNNLFKFISIEREYKEQLIVPHLIHYYLIYLHPYFDYNGRLARILSFWYSIRYVPTFSLLFISEAINNKRNKRNYYVAISNSRKTNNDITYFIEYMADIILDYTKIYIDYYSILNILKGSGEKINRSVSVAIKNVLALPVYGEGYFDWKDYKNFDSEGFSKVYYLILLNKLVDLKILKVKKHKNANLYIINKNKWKLISF